MEITNIIEALVHARHLHNFLILGDSSNYHLHFIDEDTVAWLVEIPNLPAAIWSNRGGSSTGSCVLLKTPSTLLCVLKVTREKNKTTAIASSQQEKQMPRGSVQPFGLVNQASKGL